MKLWTRLSGPFREFGALDGLSYVIDRLLRALSPQLGLFVYEMMAQPVVDKPLLPARMANMFRAQEIGVGHADLARMPVDADIVASRFRQGARCLALYRGDEMVGYMWFCFRRYEEDEVRCTYELANSDLGVFDFDLFLFPAHRMGFAFGAIWNAANQFLLRHGVAHSFSRMTRFNTASRRAHRRMGAVCVGRVWILKLWRLEAAVSTLPPHALVSVRDSHRMGLRLPFPREAARAVESLIPPD